MPSNILDIKKLLTSGDDKENSFRVLVSVASTSNLYQ